MMCDRHASKPSLDACIVAQSPPDILHQLRAQLQLFGLIDCHRLQSQSLEASIQLLHAGHRSPHDSVPHAFISVRIVLQGQNGMWHACTKGHAEVVSELLSHGSSANDADEDVSLRLSAPTPSPNPLPGPPASSFCLNSMTKFPAPMPRPPDSMPCLDPLPQPMPHPPASNHASIFCLNPLPQPLASTPCLNPLPQPPASTPCLNPLPEPPASSFCLKSRTPTST